MFLQRTIARLIDTLVSIMIMGLVALIVVRFQQKDTITLWGNWLGLWFILTLTGTSLILQHLLYQPLCDYFGGTIGKRLCKLTLTSDLQAYSKPQLWQCLLRSWPYILPTCIFLLFQSTTLNIVGISWFVLSNIVGNSALFWNKHPKTMLDALSKTSVITSR